MPLPIKSNLPSSWLPASISKPTIGSGPFQQTPTPVSKTPYIPSKGGGGGSSAPSQPSETPTQQAAQAQPSVIEAVYFSPNPNWKPSNPNALVIYIDNNGKTTGLTNMGSNVIPSGLNVKSEGFVTNASGNAESIGNIGSFIAKNISSSYKISPESKIISNPNYESISALVSGREPIMTGAVVLQGQEFNKAVYSPFTTQKEIITGFKDLRTGNEIPLSRLTNSQIKELENEGWKFNNDMSFVRKPQFITMERYKEIYEKPAAAVETKITKPTGMKSIMEDLANAYNNVNEGLKKYVTYPVSEQLGRFGITNENFATSIALAANFDLMARDYILNKNHAINDMHKVSFQFEKGIVEGVISDIKEHPMKQVLLIGAGEVLGLTLKGGSTLLSLLPDIPVSQTFANIVGMGTSNAVALGEIGSTGFKIAATAVGGYLTVDAGIKATMQAINAKNVEESGKVIGVTAKDFALISLGAYQGERFMERIIGEIRTVGVPELKGVEQGIYPQASPEKQLELFQKNIFKDISENPIAFHTTSEFGELTKGGKITPSQGASELPGLYSSTQISIPFARLPGSVESDVASFRRLVEEFFAPEKFPGVAALEPKGFREASIRFSEIQQFPGQAYIKGQGYAYFANEVPSVGILEVPKIKAEIEAIARPETGPYIFTGQRFYTEIKNVKIPIEVFKYSEEGIKKEMEAFKETMRKEFNAEEYPSYKPPRMKLIISEVTSDISKSINYELSSMNKAISRDISSSKSKIISGKSVGYSNISSGISKISSDISSDISNISSDISSALSGKSSKTSSKISKSNSGKSSSASVSLSSRSVEKMITPPQLYREERIIEQQKKLGPGYYVEVKKLKSSEFEKINRMPVTHSRAKDIGTYILDNNLARTMRIKKANKPAFDDYEFMYIPIGYYQQRMHTLREYKIRRKTMIETPEQFIKKQRYLLETPAEKRQIQAFRKQASEILK